MNGHSDVVMGALLTNNDEIYKKLKFFQNGKHLIRQFSEIF
jgi:cystathionine beta-lyase/cystathionine gamma-synthase